MTIALFCQFATEKAKLFTGRHRVMKHEQSDPRISDAILLNPFFFTLRAGKTLTIITNKMIDCRRYIEFTACSVQFPNEISPIGIHETLDDVRNRSYEPDIVHSGAKRDAARV